MLLRPHIVAEVLGVTLSDSDQAVAEETHGEIGHDAIERAVVMRAVERWPVRPGEPVGPWDDPRDPDAPGPDAAVRHTCAGALVWGLCGAGGFRYGERAPDLSLEDGLALGPTISRTAQHVLWRLLKSDGRVDADDALPPPPPDPRTRSEVAERVMWAWLGASDEPPEPRPDAERAPDRIHAVAVDLAIDLVAAPRHVIAVAAGGAAWLLAHYSQPKNGGSWAVARARRMLVAAAGGEWEPARSGGAS